MDKIVWYVMDKNTDERLLINAGRFNDDLHTFLSVVDDELLELPKEECMRRLKEHEPVKDPYSGAELYSKDLKDEQARASKKRKGDTGELRCSKGKTCVDYNYFGLRKMAAEHGIKDFAGVKNPTKSILFRVLVERGLL